ncbi:MAG: endonuclease/exonuclease/phosphatase family protein [Bacteroidota bacterium]
MFKSFSFFFLLSLFFPLQPGNPGSVNVASKKIFKENKAEKYIICSWNLKDFGNAKSTAALNYIVQTVSNCDILAIQEVVAGDGGVETVAKFAQLLNKGNAHWAYVVSPPTSGSSYKTERYAFLWKTARVQLKEKAWLEKKYSLEIDREPYFATFSFNGNEHTLVNFHAITKSMQPEKEIKYFKFLPAEYPEKNLLFLGDFNCPETHTVFNPLKAMGYKAALKDQKTTLKKTCVQNACLASAFDNFFYKPGNIHVDSAWAFYFYQQMKSMSEAWKISDHLPVFFQFELY